MSRLRWVDWGSQGYLGGWGCGVGKGGSGGVGVGEEGLVDKGHSWAAVGESQGSLRSFLNRPFHTTPTPSTPRNKEEGGEPGQRGRRVHHKQKKTQRIEADLVYKGCT